MVAGELPLKNFREKLAMEQEVMMSIANMIIEVYMLESTILKTEKLISKDGKSTHEEKNLYLHKLPSPFNK